ncbi:hypothetical protein [Thiomonas sp. X19]|uniref:hypothetical protein n=1 Tax=Thiomonas sp. X19 TaxID=1050370 RepID=UPI001E451A26|nr:hypothetical protein [Thiomonas sp. X19]
MLGLGDLGANGMGSRSASCSSTHSSTRFRMSFRTAASTSRTGRVSTPLPCWRATATKSPATTTTFRAPPVSRLRA